MRIHILSLALIPALVLAAACGTEKKAPPSTATNGAQAGGNGQMPAGHPPLNQLPPGHPPMGGQPGEAAAPVPVSADAPAGSPVTWKAPEGWTATRPTNQMRIANFTVADVAGMPVEVVVFGGIGGTAQQNVQRWIGQFTFDDAAAADEAAKVTETDANGLKVTRLDVSGTFGGGMGSGMDAHGGKSYRMLAAVIEGAPGPVQIKMVGPADVVGEHESAFDAFVGSFQASQ